MSTPTITKPGVYDIPAEVYHADPVPGGSLSSSGARKLLAPSCPAKFHYEQAHPPAPKREFDFGHAAHLEVLGTGPELVVIDADNYRTKAAQQARDEAHADGAVPLLPDEYDQVQAMAAAIRAHPVANALFNPVHGMAEQSLFWQHPPSGTWLRARLDWLPKHTPGSGRMIVADYKTSISAEPGAVARAVHAHGYHQQAAWYLDGVYSLGLAEDAAFLFVFQEKAAPYLVTVAELDKDALMWGGVLNDKAIDVYRNCRATGVWPGYTTEPELISLPTWAATHYERAQARGDLDVKGGTGR